MRDAAMKYRKECMGLSVFHHIGLPLVSMPWDLSFPK